MSRKRKPDAVTLPSDFFETERGNVWLTTDDGTGHNIWIDLGQDNRLEISIRLENYPGLNVATVKSTDADLAQHILRHCGGMIVRKLNIEGIEHVAEVIPETDD